MPAHVLAPSRVDQDPQVSPRYQRVLFVSCPTGAFCREDRCQSFFDFELVPSMRPPMEECEAAGAVRAAGAEHAVIDAPAERLTEESFVQRVQRFGPDLIVVAATFGSLKDDLIWVLKLRELVPNAAIALRGAPCYVWAAELLQGNAALDLCICGDYEVGFAALLRAGAEGAPGVAFRRSDASIQVNPPGFAPDLDALPFPDRSGIRPELYTVRGSREPQATIRVQRGCSFPCSFCLVHTVSGSRARHRSPASVAAEMRTLMQRGIKHFYLRAETFSLNRKWAIEVAHAISRECPGVRWVTATRAECVDAELVSAMASAGCYGISFGLDVASKKIGEKVGKLPAEAAAVEAMRLCDRHGIVSLAYIMIGFLWEDAESLAETARFVKNVCPDLLTVHFAHPYPGTRYYEAVRSAGLQVISPRAQAEPALALQGLSPQALERFSRRLLISHYLRPRVLMKLAKKIALPTIKGLFRKCSWGVPLKGGSLTTEQA